MGEDTKQPDEIDRPEDGDVEGNSMFIYEQARTVARDRERDVQKHAREARLLDEGKSRNKKR